MMGDKLIDNSNRHMRRSLHSHVNKTPKPKYSGKRAPAVKIVEVFIKDIDKKISQSYQSLKAAQDNGEDSSFLNQSKPMNDSTQLQDPSGMFSQLSVSVNKSFETPAKGERPHPKEKEGFMKLNDAQIMEYVRMVYDMYDIPDPMTGTKVNANNEQTSRAELTHKRIKIFKDSIQGDQLSASTQKAPKLFDSPASFRGQETTSKEGFSARRSSRRGGVVSLNSKKGQNLQGRTNNSQTHRNTHQMTKTAQIDLGRAPTARPNSIKPSTQQIYRYCFMCEEPILQCNLKTHEQDCAQLRLALTYDKAKLLEVVEGKLQRLAGQAQRGLIERDENEILAELRGVKGKVKGWMQQLKRGDLVGGVEGWSWQYSSIQKRAQAAIGAPLAVLGKLHWFGRLKHHLSQL